MTIPRIGNRPIAAPRNAARPARSSAAAIFARMRGVTLMELMIVVVVVGILTTIAYPGYRQYAARAKRTEAKSALLQIATMQERFYLQNNTYTTDLTSLGFPVVNNFLTGSKSYVISVTAADPDRKSVV